MCRLGGRHAHWLRILPVVNLDRAGSMVEVTSTGSSSVSRAAKVSLVRRSGKHGHADVVSYVPVDVRAASLNELGTLFTTWTPPAPNRTAGQEPSAGDDVRSRIGDGGFGGRARFWRHRHAPAVRDGHNPGFPYSRGSGHAASLFSARPNTRTVPGLLLARSRGPTRTGGTFAITPLTSAATVQM